MIRNHELYEKEYFKYSNRYVIMKGGGKEPFDIDKWIKAYNVIYYETKININKNNVTIDFINSINSEYQKDNNIQLSITNLNKFTNKYIDIFRMLSLMCVLKFVEQAEYNEINNFLIKDYRLFSYIDINDGISYFFMLKYGKDCDKSIQDLIKQKIEYNIKNPGSDRNAIYFKIEPDTKISDYIKPLILSINKLKEEVKSIIEKHEDGGGDYETPINKFITNLIEVLSYIINMDYTKDNYTKVSNLLYNEVKIELFSIKYLFDRYINLVRLAPSFICANKYIQDMRKLNFENIKSEADICPTYSKQVYTLIETYINEGRYIEMYIILDILIVLFDIKDKHIYNAVEQIYLSYNGFDNSNLKNYIKYILATIDYINVIGFGTPFNKTIFDLDGIPSKSYSRDKYKIIKLYELLVPTNYTKAIYGNHKETFSFNDLLEDIYNSIRIVDKTDLNNGSKQDIIKIATSKGTIVGNEILDYIKTGTKSNDTAISKILEQIQNDIYLVNLDNLKEGNIDITDKSVFSPFYTPIEIILTP